MFPRPTCDTCSAEALIPPGIRVIGITSHTVSSGERLAKHNRVAQMHRGSVLFPLIPSSCSLVQNIGPYDTQKHRFLMDTSFPAQSYRCCCELESTVREKDARVMWFSVPCLDLLLCHTGP
ncbi:hypothetical protein E2C01_067980 [Portunus trituberculatus]|uniref:Uncharacterized protein n=1 Tax=Portunus trituberculatus TaxID=210409 RepID=A0A5B7HYV8_PORTR|nr:hypothetical protein [Portunus trituberculatus]